MKKRGEKKLSPAALAALAACTYDDGDCLVKLPPQLDRKVYLEVNKALENFGGGWNRKRQGHVFSGIPRTARAIIEDVLAAEGYVDKKKALDFFETPAPIARLLVKLADIKPGHQVLEPSAGRGALVTAIGEVCSSAYVVSVEVDPANVEVLRTGGTAPTKWRSNKVIETDFLKLNGTHPDMPYTGFQRIVMNPPFQYECEFVEHAFKFLAKGGRLVSVLSSGVTFRGDKKRDAFREFVCAYSTLNRAVAAVLDTTPELGGCTFEGEFLHLSKGAFAESGTNVNTVVIVLEKP